MDHVGVVVDDLAAATAFFGELGLTAQGKGSVEGGWVDRIVGLVGVQVDFAMMETPDGHGRLELVKFHAPRRSRAASGMRRRTPWASAISHSLSMTSRPSSRACETAERSSSAKWRTTKTSISSARCGARRGSSSSWRSGSTEGSGRRECHPRSGVPWGRAGRRGPIPHIVGLRLLAS